MYEYLICVSSEYPIYISSPSNVNEGSYEIYKKCVRTHLNPDGTLIHRVSRTIGGYGLGKRHSSKIPKSKILGWYEENPLVTEEEFIVFAESEKQAIALVKECIQSDFYNWSDWGKVSPYKRKLAKYCWRHYLKMPNKE